MELPPADVTTMSGVLNLNRAGGCSENLRNAGTVPSERSETGLSPASAPISSFMGEP